MVLSELEPRALSAAGTRSRSCRSVIVSSPDNLGKYVLADGENESFSMSEVLRTMTTVVAVKHYFGKSAIAVLESLFVSVPLAAVLLTIGAAIGFILLRRRRRSQTGR